MAEADPEDEAGQVSAPDCGVIVSCRSDAIEKLVKPGEKEANQRYSDSDGQRGVITTPGHDQGLYDIVI